MSQIKQFLRSSFKRCKHWIVKKKIQENKLQAYKKPLHYETDLKEVKKLLKEGVDPNLLDKNGQTALEVIGNFEIAKTLLEHGATVDDPAKLSKILYYCGHNQKKNKVEKKIILSLLTHSNTNTDFTKTNLIRECKKASDSGKIILDYIQKQNEMNYDLNKLTKLILTCQELVKKDYPELAQDNTLNDYVENACVDSSDLVSVMGITEDITIYYF